MQENEKFTPEKAFELAKTQPKIFDLSKELYEEGKAEESKLPEYVKIAKQKGIFDIERLDLTGGTLMTIYMAVSAEAGKSEKIKEFTFNNPAREGRIILWNEEMFKEVPDISQFPRSLVIEAPPSKIDPKLPAEVLDLRLTYSDDPELMQMADVKKAQEYLRHVVAQLRELRKQGKDSLRITGIPIWLSQGASFLASREGFKKITAYTLNKEVVVYDETKKDFGRIEAKEPEKVELNLKDIEFKDIEEVKSGRQLQETLKRKGIEVELARNHVEIKGLDLKKIPPEIALRLCDSIHSFSSSLTIEGVEVFNHVGKVPDLVPKTKAQNPELLPREERQEITLDVHDILEKTDDKEKASLELAKEIVNKASDVNFVNITSALELACATKAAHAGHGLIESLSYEGEKVKSWRIE